MKDHLLDYWPAYLVGFLLVMFISFLCWAILVNSQAETFELYKSEWVCTESHQQFVTTNILVGKVSVPQVYVFDVCTNYSRKNK